MGSLLFSFSLVCAAAGAAVAGRFLYLAWADHHFGKDRRTIGDRRRTTTLVPMERRRRDRRH